MTVHPKILRFRIDHTDGDQDLKSVQVRRISRELLLDDHFWSLCSRQIDQAIDMSNRKYRFPGVRIIVRNICQDLNDSACMSQEMGRALSKPINSQMVLYNKIPSLGFDLDHIVSLYIQQGRFRRLVCDEIWQMMIIGRHIAYDEGVLPENHEFWKFSDDAIHAINELQLFLMSTNYPLIYDL